MKVRKIANPVGKGRGRGRNPKHLYAIGAGEKEDLSLRRKRKGETKEELRHSGEKKGKRGREILLPRWEEVNALLHIERRKKGKERSKSPKETQGTQRGEKR